MATLSDSELDVLADRVAARLQRPATARAQVPTILRSKQPGIFDDLDSAVAAAEAGHQFLVDKPLALRARILGAMRRKTHEVAAQISRDAVAETGFGREADKVKKNLLCADKTPGLEILEPWTRSGDDGLTIVERAPFGVVGAITPSTNPTETIINNALSMVAGGNGVVFNVHPSSKAVCRGFVASLNEAIVAQGGPAELIGCLAEPTIESAQALMRHPGVRLLVVTGGPAVVKAAMNSGKRAVAAGPGNPPAVVDETADLAKAGRDLVAGASLDNNIVCIVEKEIFAVAAIAKELKTQMLRSGAVEIPRSALAKLERLVVDKDGHPVRDFVGRDAAVIARAAGFPCPAEARLLIAEVDEQHPFVQSELLMPVVPLVAVPSWEEGIEAALRAEHGFGHTATMHSQNLAALSAMAKVIDTSIFVKNGPSFAGLGLGGEGYTSFTIASPTGEGLTTAVTFTRERRCTLVDSFRFV